MIKKIDLTFPIVLLVACIIATGVMLFYSGEKQAVELESVTNEQAIQLELTVPESFKISFFGIESPVMKMWINEEGLLEVTGDLTEGARLFFEQLIKPMVDDYIKQKLIQGEHK